ncbi:MAG: DinB family protein [Bacteroidota bacterium]
MKKIYTQYCRYNFWANQKLSAIFKELPEEKADQFVESSFPSAKKTILHIWDAEIIWLKRLHGEMPGSFPSNAFVGNTIEAIAGLLKTSRDFIDFVERQDDIFFDEKFTVQTITAGSYTQKAGEMIHHCMNHSTYHRGQLLMMARQLGLKNLPSTDMIFYLREEG